MGVDDFDSLDDPFPFSAPTQIAGAATIVSTLSNGLEDILLEKRSSTAEAEAASGEGVIEVWVTAGMTEAV